MIVLGIDPGHSTGIALYGSDGLICRTATWGEDGAAVYDILRPLVMLARGADGKNDVLAVVEMPAPAYFPRKKVSQRTNYKIAMDVGQCAQKAAMLAGFLRGLGLEVVEQKPLRGGTKRRITVPLWKAMFPEYKGRTSNHARDAAVIAQREYQRRKSLPGEIADQRIQERKDGER